MIRRSGAVLLLLGFLAQAGDGVASTLCHVGMDHGPEAPHKHHEEAGSDAGGHAHHGHGDADPVAHDSPSHHVPDGPHGPHGPGAHSEEEPCPFGSGAVMVCAGAGTALAPTGLLRAPGFPLLPMTAPSAMDSPGAILAHETFRPPRA